MVDNTDAAARRRELAMLLRDLSWTIHRRVPDVTGIEPLTSTDLAVLKHVLEAPGMTVTELSRHMALKQSNTSAAVRTLADRGLVTKESSASDRRISRLFPTDKAMAQDEAIGDAWAGPIRKALAGLDAAQAAALDDAVQALQELNSRLRSDQTFPGSS
ncbi:MarR family winged helix-turn-helix transcriptional regulator [Arthrobacter sp. ZGTC212]|uniref:MarR family winged helix-turn-helix transcriptional regulator n=1 Tax=Arthrobacter sp. ZGTC212 TaxID=2058899 RepID=UPI002157922E|nr:MarR family transcriptional regulator [Arthrobacter sp. ZGTC212]